MFWNSVQNLQIIFKTAQIAKSPWIILIVFIITMSAGKIQNVLSKVVTDYITDFISIRFTDKSIVEWVNWASQKTVNYYSLQ